MLLPNWQKPKDKKNIKKTKKKQTNKTKNTNLNNSISIEGPPRGIIIKEL
jgi:hypothetical protein